METNPSPETQNQPTLWTNEDVANFFRCTVRHVQNLQKYGLPFLHLGRLVRFDPEEVRDFLKRNRRLSESTARRIRRKDTAARVLAR